MVTAHLDIKESILLKSSDKAFHVLYYIITQTNIEDNIWYSDKINKNVILSMLKIASPTLEKHIATLKQKELLIPIARGAYSLNMKILSL